MSSIDLVILGIVLEKPQSAYDIQKDVEYHNFPRWTKISIPSVYKKVLRLKEKGYLTSDVVKGERFAEKAIYSITDAGRAYFETLMDTISEQDVPLTFDFNVMIYAVFRFCYQHFADPRCGPRRWPWRVGRGQSSGRIWFRQPCLQCSCAIK